MCIHCRQTTQLSAATAAVFMLFMSLTFLLHLQFPNIISAKYVSNANEFPSISRCKSGTRWLKLHWGKQRKTNRDRGKEIKMNSVVVLLFLGTSFFSRSKFSIWIVSNAKKNNQNTLQSSLLTSIPIHSEIHCDGCVFHSHLHYIVMLVVERRWKVKPSSSGPWRVIISDESERE